MFGSRLKKHLNIGIYRYKSLLKLWKESVRIAKVMLDGLTYECK